MVFGEEVGLGRFFHLPNSLKQSMSVPTGESILMPDMMGGAIAGAQTEAKSMELRRLDENQQIWTGR